jgi:hypothetical protein
MDEKTDTQGENQKEGSQQAKPSGAAAYWALMNEQEEMLKKFKKVAHKDDESADES